MPSPRGAARLHAAESAALASLIADSGKTTRSQFTYCLSDGAARAAVHTAVDGRAIPRRRTPRVNGCDDKCMQCGLPKRLGAAARRRYFYNFRAHYCLAPSNRQEDFSYSVGLSKCLLVERIFTQCL